jgi:hypothetical protein
MHLELPEHSIRSLCRELLDANPYVGGRALTRALRARHGAVGRTERVLAIWREERESRRLPRPTPVITPAAELAAQLHAAQARCAELQLRAEKAELREEAHQRQWLMEIDRLRQALRAQADQAAALHPLQTQLIRLQVENASLREALQRAPVEHDRSPD